MLGMTPPPLHLHGSGADRVAWSVDAGDDGFDGAAMERAMLAARREAYAALEDLDAA